MSERLPDIHFSDGEQSSHRELEDLTRELVDKYSTSEHHVARGKRLGMEELNQLSTELQHFFETYGDDNSAHDPEILIRYINGDLRIQEGEMEQLVEDLKKYYEKYYEKSK